MWQFSTYLCGVIKNINNMENLTIDGNVFNLEQTGGGCTALTFIDDKGTCYMITEHNDPTAPESLNSIVDFGAVDSEGYHIFSVEGIKINQIALKR
jgi:hypothetical protein